MHFINHQPNLSVSTVGESYCQIYKHIFKRTFIMGQREYTFHPDI